MGCKLSHTSDALCSDHQRRRVCKILQAPDRQMSSTVSISSYAHDRKTKPIPILKKSHMCYVQSLVSGLWSSHHYGIPYQGILASLFSLMIIPQ